jgi:DNA/RNA endonuclease YhcR with UshA esterase domain
LNGFLYKRVPLDWRYLDTSKGEFMKRSNSALRFLATALLAFAAASAHAAPDAISIAQARALPLGTVVTVAGSVTTPSGAFESSFFDVGFGLQDKSGGIYVSLQTNLGVAPRAQARVTGTLTDSFGLLLLVPGSPSDVKVHGSGPRVAPRFVTTGGVGESTEGLLVQVVGTITQGPESDLPYGYKLYVNDGSGELTIFVNTQTGINLSGLAVGQTVSVTGFSSQFDTHYEIDPRFPADIVVQAP